MNKSRSKKLVLNFLALLFFSITSSPIYAKTIVLGTTEWPPYVQNSSNKGYAYDIVYAAFKAAGYNDIRIIFMPWTDAEKAVNDGQLDGIFPEYYSHERKTSVIYSDPFSDSPVGFYKKLSSGIHYPNSHPDKKVLSTLQKMHKYRFGVVKGYVNIAAFDNDKNLEKIYVESDLDNLKQLYQGNVNLIFIDKYTAEYLLHHQLSSDYSDQLVFMNPPLGYKKLYVAISKKAPNARNIAEDFNEGLKKIKENGTFTKIIDLDAETVDDNIV